MIKIERSRENIFRRTTRNVHCFISEIEDQRLLDDKGGEGVRKEGLSDLEFDCFLLNGI